MGSYASQWVHRRFGGFMSGMLKAGLQGHLPRPWSDSHKQSAEECALLTAPSGSSCGLFYLLMQWGQGLLVALARFPVSQVEIRILTARVPLGGCEAQLWANIRFGVRPGTSEAAGGAAVSLQSTAWNRTADCGSGGTA